MKHLTLPLFWQHYQSLPKKVQKLADKNFQLLKSNPTHPSLHFKKQDINRHCGLFVLASNIGRWGVKNQKALSGFGLVHMTNMINC